MNTADSLYILAHQLKPSESLKSVRVMDDRFLLIQTNAGDLVVIYLINVELPLSDIKKALTDNTAQNIFTLFVISEDLIPADGQTVEFMSFLKALHTVYHEKIYVYRADEHGIVIFPVRFRAQRPGADYQAIYHSPIDVENIRVEHIETGYPMNGFWATAHFKQKVEAVPDSQSHQRPFSEHFYQQQNQTRDRSSHSRSSRKSAKNLSLRRHYQILGIALHATEEEIKGAYRQLARQYHPDLNTSPRANERMQEINLAYREIMRQFD